MMSRSRLVAAVLMLALTLIAGCRQQPAPAEDTAPAAESPPQAAPEYYGTLEPFASEAVYFLLTDRFVDGDPGNNQEHQAAGDWHTFDRPIQNQDGQVGNIGYLGGDFRGILDNAGYIAEMGFTAVWITPIVNNPDEAFRGGSLLGEAFFADRGKTGYHGYWGVNFFQVDEHLESEGLRFADLTRELRDQHQLKLVLDIVCNHGSPSYSMPEDQPMFGEIYDAEGTLIADHQNLHPTELDSSNPLHRFFHPETDLAELSNIDETNPAVLEYFTAAYSHWIGQGVAALRIDTIRHMPHAYWKAFSDRIRRQYPGLFMFGESFDYEAANIAQHTYPENGGISVLDFPGRQAMTATFEDPDSDYAGVLDYLHLTDGVYQNPYELMLFYDNHDVPRMNAAASGFIDAHNWMFTSRGIPVVYYGSETAFRAGRPEHGGNRDYFGLQRLQAAEQSPVRQSLAAIANIRRQSPALQRGLQFNLEYSGHKAAFLRVYQHGEVNQTALVLLNKGAREAGFRIDQWLSSGDWRDALSGEQFSLAADAVLQLTVPAHGVRVLLLDQPNNNAPLARELQQLQRKANRG